MIQNPKGIDYPIQEMQQLFEANLWTDILANKKEFNHRAWRNLRDSLLIPEVQIDDTNEYKEVKFQDNLTVLSWFDVAPSTDSMDGNQITQEVGIFFAVNLVELYPSLSHRAVEEVHMDVKNVILQRPTTWDVTGLTTGIEAYGDYDITNLKHPDMQPWHVFKYNCNVSFTLNCK